MNEPTDYKTPKNLLARMQVVHLGKILFNLQFVALAIMMASALSFLITALYYLLLISITLGTVGIIYLVYPQFSNWWSGGETLQNITSVLAESWQFTVPVVAVLAVASIVCLCFDNQKKHISRIITSIVICVLAILVLILKLVGGTI